MAVVAETGTTAACSNVRLAGLRASLSARAHRVLGEGAVRDAEHLVTDLELGHVGADPTTVPATSRPGTGFFGPRNPKPMTRIRYGSPRHEVRGAPVDPGCAHLHEHFVRRDVGRVDVAEMKDFGGAVDVLQDRLHCCLCCRIVC